MPTISEFKLPEWLTVEWQERIAFSLIIAVLLTVIVVKYNKTKEVY